MSEAESAYLYLDSRPSISLAGSGEKPKLSWTRRHFCGSLDDHSRPQSWLRFPLVT